MQHGSCSPFALPRKFRVGLGAPYPAHKFPANVAAGSDTRGGYVARHPFIVYTDGCVRRGGVEPRSGSEEYARETVHRRSAERPARGFSASTGFAPGKVSKPRLDRATFARSCLLRAKCSFFCQRLRSSKPPVNTLIPTHSLRGAKL